MQRLSALSVLLVGLITVPSSSAWSGLINVPNDHPTVRGAIAVATAGDTVFIQTGFYREPGEFLLHVQPGVTVMSDPWTDDYLESAVLSEIAMYLAPGPEPTIIQGLWFLDRYVWLNNSQSVVRNCKFGWGWEFDTYFFRFMQEGGTVDGCFLLGWPGSHAFPYHFDIRGGPVVIENNVIAPGGYLTTIQDLYGIGSVRFANNTLVGEFTPGFRLPGVTFEVENNIFYDMFGYSTIWCDEETVFRNNAIFSVLTEVEITCPVDETNIFEDPLLCNPEVILEIIDFATLNDFALDANSPCIGAGVDGSTIGALGVGCGTTGVPDAETSPELKLPSLSVHPSPVQVGSKLVLPQGFDLGTGSEFKLYDVRGGLIGAKIVREGAAVDWPRSWTSPTIPRGIYFIELRGATAVATGRVVVSD